MSEICEGSLITQESQSGGLLCTWAREKLGCQLCGRLLLREAPRAFWHSSKLRSKISVFSYAKLPSDLFVVGVVLVAVELRLPVEEAAAAPADPVLRKKMLR